VQIRLSDNISWVTVLSNNVLANQIISFIPQGITESCKMQPGDVFVNDLENVDNNVVLHLSIPAQKVPILKAELSNPVSDFYKNNQFTPYIDNTFPLVVNKQVTSDSTVGGNGVVNVNGDGTAGSAPTTVTGGQSAGPTSDGLQRGAIISMSVVGSTVVYAALTAFVIRAYKRSKARSQAGGSGQQGASVYGQAISAPVMQENSLGWNR